MKSILKVLSHPVTQFNLILVGTMCLIQGIHLHAHYMMDIDVDSYVTAFCKKTADECERIVNRYD